MTQVLHRCHHPKCGERTDPDKAACPRHWRELPRKLRDKINSLCRPGQWVDKNPSREYILAMREAREFWMTEWGAKRQC